MTYYTFFRLLVFTNFLFFATNATCQNSQQDTLNSQQDTLKRSIGIDLSFINNFLPLEENIGIRGKYSLYFLKYRKNDRYAKHAINIFSRSNIREVESPTDVDDFFFNINYKIGFGKRSLVFNKCYVHFGGELMLDYLLLVRKVLDNHEEENENVPALFNTNYEHDTGVLLGPFVGFEYRFTKRFSLYIEAGYYLSFTYIYENFTSDSTPISNFTQKQISFGTNISFPSSIILFYNF